MELKFFSSAKLGVSKFPRNDSGSNGIDYDAKIGCDYVEKMGSNYSLVKLTNPKGISVVLNCVPELYEKTPRVSVQKPFRKILDVGLKKKIKVYPTVDPKDEGDYRDAVKVSEKIPYNILGSFWKELSDNFKATSDLEYSAEKAYHESLSGMKDVQTGDKMKRLQKLTDIYKKGNLISI